MAILFKGNYIKTIILTPTNMQSQLLRQLLKILAFELSYDIF